MKLGGFLGLSTLRALAAPVAAGQIWAHAAKITVLLPSILQPPRVSQSNHPVQLSSDDQSILCYPVSSTNDDSG